MAFKCLVCGKRSYSEYCFQHKRRAPIKSATRNKPTTSTTSSRRKAAVNELDRVFSAYVRISNANSSGYVKCFVTGATHHWKEIDAGHFIPRGKIGTRFSEKNVHPQSQYSNRVLNGDIERYEQALIKVYGDNIIDELRSASTHRVSTVEIEEMILDYSDRLLKLKRERGIV